MAEDLILNELEAKIRTLDEYKAKIEELRVENNDLLSKLQTKEEDAMEVIKYLRAENDSLQEKLRIYSEESATAKADAETTVRTANEERDRAIAEMEAKFKVNEDTREGEVRKLREELFALKAFKDRKEVLEAELERVHQELTDAQAAHKEAMTGVERKLIEEKTRLQKEAHAQLMEIKRNTDEEVVNRLDVSTKRILQQNRRLAEDLKLHVQETAELQRVKGKLEEETKKLRRDLELNEEQMKEYAQDRFRHSKQVKELQSKVKNLEKSLAQVVKDFERERERLLQKGKSDMHQTEVENTGLRKLVKVKEREHTKIKRLASDIIAQRSEVEQFFLEALEQVRDEVGKERNRPPPAGPERSNRDGGGGGNTFLTGVGEESSTHFHGKLPTIKAGSLSGRGGGGSQAPTQPPPYIPNQRVDIRDLSWEVTNLPPPTPLSLACAPPVLRCTCVRSHELRARALGIRVACRVALQRNPTQSALAGCDGDNRAGQRASFAPTLCKNQPESDGGRRWRVGTWRPDGADGY